MARDECRRRMPGTPLVGSPIVDLDELVGNDGIISVSLFEIVSDAAPRYEGVEHRSADDGRVHRQLSGLTDNSRTLIQSHQPGGTDESDCGKTLRITCAKHDCVSTGEGGAHKDTRVADYLIDEIGDE